MSDDKPQEDPSMEDILASIRRIITDDEEAEGAGEEEATEEVAAEESTDAEEEADMAGEDSENEDVLELTQMLQDDGSTVDLSDEPEPEPEPEAEPESEAEPEPEAEPETPIAAETEALISDAAFIASIDSLSKLAGVNKPASSEISDLKFSGQGDTIEGIVIQMLRPMLRDWLDQNLPAIVERIVQNEIRKLVRQADSD